VTIAIPTFNRAHYLPKAIEAALAQTHRNLEILISDNASTDKTPEICAHYAQNDPRIRYVRQPSNIGPTENFRFVLENASGEYFIWLGDDDWIDENYIEVCAETLLENPDVSIAVGVPWYYEGEVFRYTGTIINLPQASPVDRVKGYFSRVRHNSVLCGVMRTRQLRGVDMRDEYGGDVLMAAALAFTGKIVVLDTTTLHRRLGGHSSDIERLVKNMSWSWMERYFPLTTAARNVFCSITRWEKVYSSLPGWRRYILAIECLFLALVRKLRAVGHRGQGRE
jgi:glycosyltransferase domain-containing protein